MRQGREVSQQHVTRQTLEGKCGSFPRKNLETPLKIVLIERGGENEDLEVEEARVNNLVLFIV